MGIGHCGFHLRPHNGDIQVAVILGKEVRMRSIGLVCFSLLLLAGCSKPSAKVGDWYERTEDKKRISVTDVGTGRTLLDKFYRLKHYKSDPVDTSFFSEKDRTVCVAGSVIDFPDSSSHLSSDCIWWGETSSRSFTQYGMPCVNVITYFHIVPKAILERDYRKVE